MMLKTGGEEIETEEYYSPCFCFCGYTNYISAGAGSTFPFDVCGNVKLQNKTRNSSYTPPPLHPLFFENVYTHIIWIHRPHQQWPLRVVYRVRCLFKEQRPPIVVENAVVVLFFLITTSPLTRSYIIISFLTRS